MKHNKSLREQRRTQVLRDAGLRELRWISLVLFWLLLAFGVIDALLHPDDGSTRWRLFSSLIPSMVAGAVFLAVRHRTSCRRCGVLVIVPILTLQASITYTASMTGQQANLGYMVVIITLLGALAVSTVEYVITQAITVALTVYTLRLLIAEPISSESFTTWVAVITVATAAATNLHLARRSGLRHLADALWGLEREADEDRLTGLAGRRGLDRSFPELREQARRIDSPLFALFIDVDGLKGVNDTAGHDVGDAVIDVVAASLRRHCRSADVVCRWGGDEFVIVGIGSGPDPSRFELVVSDYLSVVNPAPQSWSGRVSVGHATLAAADAELLVLLGQADEDMYQRRAVRVRNEASATHSD